MNKLGFLRNLSVNLCKKCLVTNFTGLWTQKAFKEQAQSLAEVIREMGDPFLHDNAQFLVLDSRDILNESVINTVQSVENLGADQYKAYHQSVIADNTNSIHETTKNNNLPLFRQPTPKSKGKKAGLISMLKCDIELFFRLYIVMQHRNGDTAAFFRHENHPYPPSLSDKGKLRIGEKSDLLNLLPEEAEM